jgi:ubiquinone/menaquinone biosynthesis C-methylase UbiE
MIESLPCDPEFLRGRYDRLAPWYVLFEWLLWLPWGIRERTVRLLDLRAGQRVLEVGCGTGRNFKYLQAALGPEGHVYGVDLSEGMLSRCRALCDRHGWRNVTLVRADALSYTVPQNPDAILFSLSYATMLHRVRILENVWRQLKLGGRLVIMEAKLMRGVTGRLQQLFIVPLMKATVLGDPDHKAWEDLGALTRDVYVEERLLGSYLICRGTKSVV